MRTYVLVHNNTGIPDLLKLCQYPTAGHNGPLIGRLGWVRGLAYISFS